MDNAVSCRVLYWALHARYESLLTAVGSKCNKLLRPRPGASNNFNTAPCLCFAAEYCGDDDERVGHDRDEGEEDE